MKNIRIFEPAMCCATGLCGPSIDPELLRISTLLSSLKEKGIVVERYNLTSHPQVFAQNEAVKELLSKHGTAILPVTTSGDDVVLTGRYPTNQEVLAWLQVDAQAIGLKEEPACCAAETASGCSCSAAGCAADGDVAAGTGCCCSAEEGDHHGTI
ncbi:arsenite efflux transporter metallochaperone ArsD [uncultured Selenomonas sp.]|uniref:arsenite efflux transporter metallochaperone ArsD n=1 Tax=uncultured Selenomonas sp. TaxID=159275 RepID=UPI0025891FBD|nr:arsenite efflux transporter metallochaperone ArsD [uncultured Selenomonas sp.]